MFADTVEALKLLRNRVNEKSAPTIYDVKVNERAYEDIMSLRCKVASLEVEHELMIVALNKTGVKP